MSEHRWQKILVVHDAELNRQMLADLLIGHYNVAMAQGGEQALTLANLDGLTEIPNRRQFNTTYAQEWARSTRSGQPLSLALMDVDFFKQYNDRLYLAKGSGRNCVMGL